MLRGCKARCTFFLIHERESEIRCQFERAHRKAQSLRRFDDLCERSACEKPYVLGADFYALDFLWEMKCLEPVISEKLVGSGIEPYFSYRQTPRELSWRCPADANPSDRVMELVA